MGEENRLPDCLSLFQAFGLSGPDGRRPPRGTVTSETHTATIVDMSDPHEKDFEDASIICWERAVYHAEKAQRVAEDALRLWELGVAAVREQQAMASAYLALGGYGQDSQAYRELGLPFNESDLPDSSED